MKGNLKMTIYFQPVRQPYAGQNNFQKNNKLNKNVAFGVNQNDALIIRKVHQLFNVAQVKEIVEKAGEKLPKNLEQNLKILLKKGRALNYQQLPHDSKHKFVLIKPVIKNNEKSSVVFVKIGQSYKEVESTDKEVVSSLQSLCNIANQGELADIDKTFASHLRKAFKK